MQALLQRSKSIIWSIWTSLNGRWERISWCWAYLSIRKCQFVLYTIICIPRYLCRLFSDQQHYRESLHFTVLIIFYPDHASLNQLWNYIITAINLTLTVDYQVIIIWKTAVMIVQLEILRLETKDFCNSKLRGLRDTRRSSSKVTRLRTHKWVLTWLENYIEST